MKKKLVTVLVLALVCAVGTPLGGCTVFGIRTGEEAPYTVLLEDGDFEVRQYAETLIAETVTQGEYDEAGNAAFRRLGGFIFGKNQTQESVAMTAPVFQEVEREPESESIAMTAPVFQEADGDVWTQRFVMPSEYTKDTLPVPTDPNVEIKTIPPMKFATVRYSGFLSQESIDENTRRLRAWIAERGLEESGRARSAGYDPPWAIPFLRRNEVQIEVR